MVGIKIKNSSFVRTDEGLACTAWNCVGNMQEQDFAT